MGLRLLRLRGAFTPFCSTSGPEREQQRCVRNGVVPVGSHSFAVLPVGPDQAREREREVVGGKQVKRRFGRDGDGWIRTWRKLSTKKKKRKTCDTPHHPNFPISEAFL